ncbi:MAG: cysteine--tRNA ligase, partial [Alphaproteobacteria bacterium]
ASLLVGAGLLGLLQGDAAGWLGYGNSDDAAEALLARREEARQSRDFGEADRIRDLLGERGYRIEDTPKGPRLRRLSHG